MISFLECLSAYPLVQGQAPWFFKETRVGYPIEIGEAVISHLSINTVEYITIESRIPFILDSIVISLRPLTPYQHWPYSKFHRHHRCLLCAIEERTIVAHVMNNYCYFYTMLTVFGDFTATMALVVSPKRLCLCFL